LKYFLQARLEEASLMGFGGYDKPIFNFVMTVLKNLCGPFKSLPKKIVSNQVEDPYKSLIQQVKSLFPELGDGFIEQCLVEMNSKVESVINAILENNLPPTLAKLDRKMPRKSKKKLQLLNNNQRSNWFLREKIFTTMMNSISLIIQKKWILQKYI